MFPRCFFILLVCAMVATLTISVWGDPYVGIVNQDGAPIRCGPGRDYYSTDMLRQGDPVEVYRIDEGGWCAIRPPSSSFCWVAEPHLRMTDDEGVAEVVGDDVLAYVGSRVRDTRDVVQVRLQRGELVEVVGSDDLPSPDGHGSHTWYRIAPPAGEFRWVHLEFVDRQERPQREQDVAAEDQSNNQDGSVAQETNDSESMAVIAAKWKPLPPGTLRKRAGRAVARRSTLPKQTAVAAHREPAATFELDEEPAPAENPPRLLGAVQASPLRPASAIEPVRDEEPSTAVVMASATEDSDSYEQKFEQLDVEFSLIVARPTAQWDLQPLILRAQEIIRSTRSPLTREKTHALLEKMRQFDHLQKGTAPLGGVVVPTVAATRAVVAQPASYGVDPRPLATGTYGPTGTANIPANSGLPKLLAALESLMPPAPPQSGGGPPANGLSTAPVAATGSPPVSAAAVQDPATAPIAPDGLVWGVPIRPATSGARIPGASAAVSPGAGYSAAAGPVASSGIGSVPVGTGQSVSALGRLAGAILYPLGSGQSNGAVAGTAPNFDGRGWLMPLVSRKGGAPAGRQYMPPYVLTDQQGNVLQFVTPAPGVNLHRYVEQEIGVFGQNRSFDHLQQPHVTASRIVQLDRHRR